MDEIDDIDYYIDYDNDTIDLGPNPDLRRNWAEHNIGDISSYVDEDFNDASLENVEESMENYYETDEEMTLLYNDLMEYINHQGIPLGQFLAQTDLEQLLEYFTEN
jgi:hypothetical protein